MVVAIVAAVHEEVGDFLARGGLRPAQQDGSTRFYESPSGGHVVAVGGIGKGSAQGATRSAVERYRPDLIISAGFAGGVKLGMRSGEIFLCDTVWAVEGPPSGWTPETAQSISLVAQGDDGGPAGEGSPGAPGHSRGGCLTVSRVVSESAMKARIGARFPVSVVDMESFWVSQAAARYGVPAIVVRAVLDPLEQSLPSFIERAAAKGVDGRWKHALRFALSRPAEIPALFRVAGQARAARAALAGMLDSLT